MSECDQILMFVEVAECGSFSAAGEKLGISGTAVSKQVTLLEEKLGLTLLKRSTRCLDLTDVGQDIYQQGLKLRQRFYGISEYAASMQGSPQGTLTIAANITLGKVVLLQRLNKFLKDNPLLNVNIHFSDQFPDFVKQEHIDVAFGYSMDVVPVTAENLICRRLSSIQRVFCASPDYLKQHGTPVNYTDFANHSYITHTARNEDAILSECLQREVSFKRVILLDNSDALLFAVKSGLGLANVGNVVVAEDLAEQQLIPLEFEREEPVVPVYLFYQKSRYMLPKIRKFIEMMLG